MGALLLDTSVSSVDLIWNLTLLYHWIWELWQQKRLSFFGRLALNLYSIVSGIRQLWHQRMCQQNYRMGVLSLHTSSSSIILLLNLTPLYHSIWIYDNNFDLSKRYRMGVLSLDISFFGCLNFDSIGSMDLGVMTKKDETSKVTEWVPYHWIHQLLR